MSGYHNGEQISAFWLFRNQAAPSADQQISSKTVTKQVEQ